MYFCDIHCYKISIILDFYQILFLRQNKRMSVTIYDDSVHVMADQHGDNDVLDIRYMVYPSAFVPLGLPDKPEF